MINATSYLELLNENKNSYFFFRKNRNIYLSSRQVYKYKQSIYAYYDVDMPIVESPSIQFNSSGIGFQNDWCTVQIGRGNEDWGAGENISLALSKNSSPYNFFKLASNYGHLRVSYMHGFLERNQDNVNRYLNSRGIEWSNKKSLVLGFSETIIYSGKDRAIDFAYFNPLSSHLEVELNNRLNTPGDWNSNAVWQIHLDWLIRQRMRLSMNYLADEFVLDPNIEIGKEHGKAFSSRFSILVLSSEKYNINLMINYVNVGTPTFRHGVGTNNFVQNDIPLGFNNGSDLKERSIGVSYSKINNLFLNFICGVVHSGQQSLFYNPYEPYLDYIGDKFPSGITNKKSYVKNQLIWKFKNNIYINVNITLTPKDIKDNKYIMEIGLNK